MDICDTGNRYDRTDLCFLYFYFIQTFKLIELTDLNFAELVRLMMVDDDAVLIYFQVTVVDLTNADTPYILVVINRTDQNLCLCIRISLRRRDVIQNGLEQWLHIHIRIVQVLLCISRTCRCIQEWTVKLLVGCIQIHQKFENLVHNLLRTCFRTVNLIDTYDNRQIQFQCFTQNEFGLRHRALVCVYQKDNAVYHLKNTLYLAAEVRMSWCIDNVDLGAVVINSRILGQNRDTSLTLNIVRVHDTIDYFLIGTEYTALAEQLVYQRRFTVVNVSDNCNVSDIFPFHFHICLLSFLMMIHYMY